MESSDKHLAQMTLCLGLHTRRHFVAWGRRIRVSYSSRLLAVRALDFLPLAVMACPRMFCTCFFFIYMLEALMTQHIKYAEPPAPACQRGSRAPFFICGNARSICVLLHAIVASWSLACFTRTFLLLVRLSLLSCISIFHRNRRAPVRFNSSVIMVAPYDYLTAPMHHVDKRC